MAKKIPKEWLIDPALQSKKEPCQHKGCLQHVSHPCEGCGRIAGRPARVVYREQLKNLLNQKFEIPEKLAEELSSSIENLARDLAIFAGHDGVKIKW